MKLTDLHPSWVGAGGEGIFDKDHNPVPERNGVGILLDCPCGKCDEYNRLFVPFENPLDGGPMTADKYGWKRTGANFETLTLEPSIQRHKVNGYGCEWHGWIRNGEIINA